MADRLDGKLDTRAITPSFDHFPLMNAPTPAPLALRKYARVEGVTLPLSEDLCPSGGSNSPAVRARNLTQFGEKGKNASKT